MPGGYRRTRKCSEDERGQADEWRGEPHQVVQRQLDAPATLYGPNSQLLFGPTFGLGLGRVCGHWSHWMPVDGPNLFYLLAVPGRRLGRYPEIYMFLRVQCIGVHPPYHSLLIHDALHLVRSRRGRSHHRWSHRAGAS